MSKKYWQSFAQLRDDDNFRKAQKDEFKEELPFEDFDDKGLLDAKSPRRDFLKYLGFSTAAASLAACKVPVRKAIPYVEKPENVVPGIAKYYATTFVQDGEVVPAVAKVRDGRPIKMEGNELSSLTRGGTSPRMQASVLDLYDTYRMRFPRRKSGNNWVELPSYSQADTQIQNALAGLGGAPVILLTSTIVSPATRQLITQFLGRYPGSRHVQYDAISASGMLQANEASFGRRALPTYRFDQARTIVSIGADFLGTWIAPVEFARQYSAGRKINEKAPAMSKHYQLESLLSMTGANADERYTHRPSETGAVAMALLAAVGGSAPAVSLSDPKLAQAIQKIGTELRSAGGNGLVVCGSNDVNVQQVVNAINSAIGAYGKTISWATPVTTKQGIDKDMADLVTQMNAGQIGALLICDANPAYDYYNSAAFASGIKKCRLSVSFNEKMDETTELCQYALPTHHYLESWGDAEARAGYVSFIQPTIYPLFKTRPWQTSLLKWSGGAGDWETYFRQYWTGRLGGTTGFDKALQDGVVEPGGLKGGNTVVNSANMLTTVELSDTSSTATENTTPVAQNTATPPATTDAAPVRTAVNTGGLAGAFAAITGARKGGKNEVILYQNVAMGSGKQSGNPWLLELPDPVTKATWDNFAMISVAKAGELGIELDTDYEYYPQKPVIEISANGKTMQLPVLVIPGMQKDTIAVSVGYGRNAAFSKAGEGVGQNVFGLARFNGTTVDYHNDVTLAEKTVGEHKIAQTQIHNSYENRFEVVRETTMGSFMADRNEFKEYRAELAADYAPKTGDYRKEGTLYGDHVQPGLKWGINIDLNSCIGCGACVVACHAENNVPVVGKSEVLRAHEMHWLRIDRYFVSEDNNPDNVKAVVFQPMLCQHCDNAPCENVCPVAATPHSSEGYNMMTYNRCIGTRYCANNCPYKVRRFNWGDYTGASTHGVGGPKLGTGVLDPVVAEMNDDLTRMVLNPDVTTRSRGVMEKCSFCVQRIQEGKLKAKLENRPHRDGDVKSACMQACPTEAIVFGNANDAGSRLSRSRNENSQRLFHVIEQLHTLPNVSYLAKIRNTAELVHKQQKNGVGHGGQGESHVPAGEDKQQKTEHSTSH